MLSTTSQISKSSKKWCIDEEGAKIKTLILSTNKELEIATESQSDKIKNALSMKFPLERKDNFKAFFLI